MKAQRGFVALLMMVLVAVGVFGAMAAWVASEPPPSKQSINQQVLMQAREALLAYVAVSGDPAKVLTQKTRLPCPDKDGDGAADTAPDSSHCGITRQPEIGLLPWKTLGLAPLRDADGECLWYAVSGDFKDANVDPSAVPPPIAVNADTDGAITVTNEAGSSLATKLVAVVFAPGAKLGSQVRTNSAMIGADRPCATPTGATPNGGAAADVAGYLDSGKIDITVTPPTITFIQLTGTVDKQSELNDQLAWITTDDYAAIAMQRNTAVLKTAFTSAVTAASAGGRWPFAAAKPGDMCEQGRYSGFLPTSCIYVHPTSGETLSFALGTPKAMLDDDWPELAFYAVAPGCAFSASGCTPATGPALSLPTNATAKAVMLMRGRQQPSLGCPLSTAPTLWEKWLPCIESPNQSELLDPMTLKTRTFITPDRRPVSNDILEELK
ncbi:hypothetical protein [Polaromonas sp. YR568]|uniref:hypothetical protein n=1 Tax=Polaromonas sp. YR568 TaxID=1855301 RepID=UPI00398BC936